MGPPNPADDIGHQAIKMQQDSRRHGNTGLVDLSFALPMLGIALERGKINGGTLVKQLGEQEGGRISSNESSPVRVGKKTRLQQENESVPKGWFRIETLGQIVLTEWLVQLGPDARVNFVKGKGKVLTFGAPKAGG